ncbi:protein of unknown function [Serratia sp. Tan611]|nr:protein of unknown function [Serratia sp. Tan611]
MFVQRLAGGNGMPFRQAAATAGSGGVLGDKRRVAAHRRLFTVVFGLGVGQTLVDEIACVAEDHGEAFLFQVEPIFIVQAEFGAEWRGL